MNLFAELKRRNVFRVGIAYAVAAWLLLQVGDVLVGLMGLPDWSLRLVLLILLLGFPVAVVVSWIYELTPEGVKREAEVDRSRSITGHTARKLDLITIGLVVVGAGLLAVDRFVLQESRPGFPVGVASPSTAQPPETRAIAVLPFAHRSSREDDRYFTDGIHDDLLTQLAKIRDLNVISRTSVMQYRDTEMRVPDIARELGVGVVLEGGVQRAGDRVRINAQLIDAASDKHIWSETYDREMTVENLFDIQTEIARKIVEAVRGNLSAEETRAISKAPTSNLLAYEAYLRAREFMNQVDYGLEKYEQALPWAERAIEADPEFALAYVLMVQVHGQFRWSGDDSRQRREAALAALAKAEAIDPELPDLHLARADFAYRFDLDYERCLTEVQRGMHASPGNAELLRLRALAERRLGRWEESVRFFSAARQLDPGNVFYLNVQAETLFNMNAWDRAVPMLDRLIERYPDSADITAMRGFAYLWSKGDPGPIREAFAKLRVSRSNHAMILKKDLPLLERDFATGVEVLEELAASAGWNFIFPGMAENALAENYWHLGDREKARAVWSSVLERLGGLLETDDPRQALGLGELAVAYARLGELPAALKAADTARRLLPESRDHLFGVFIAENRTRTLALAGLRDEALSEVRRLLETPVGFNRWELYLDPRWDFFRDDERFNELVRPDNLQQSELARRIPDSQLAAVVLFE